MSELSFQSKYAFSRADVASFDTRSPVKHARESHHSFRFPQPCLADHCTARDNTSNFNAKMPPELLAEILSYLSARERLSAAETCFYWRAAADTYPRIWSDLLAFGAATPGLVVALRRARGNVPVRLSFSVEDEFSARILPHLGKHMHKVTTLRICVSGQWCEALNIALAAPAPRLIRTAIEVRSNQSSIFYMLHSNIFGGDAPYLKQLLLKGVFPPATSTPAFQTVIHFRLSASHPTPERIAAAHARFPALRWYELDIDPPISWRDMQVEVAPASEYLHTLQLDNCFGGMIGQVPHTGLKRVMIGRSDSVSTKDLLSALNLSPDVLAVLDDGREDSFNRYSISAGKRGDIMQTRIVRSMLEKSGPRCIFSPIICQNLISLVTDAHLWSTLPSLWSALPASRKYIVFTRLEILHLVFSVTPTQRLHFVTPQLRLLRLASCVHDCEVDVSALLASLTPLGTVTLELDGLTLDDPSNTPGATFRSCNAEAFEAVWSVKTHLRTVSAEDKMEALVEALQTEI